MDASTASPTNKTRAAPATYLLVIGEAAALAWVLAERRMAFPAMRSADAGRLEIGDELLIYTTRGCFHNPSRDMGRVMGRATVASRAVALATPVTFGDRRFTYGCDLDVLGVAPLRDGVELARLVPQLQAFPDPRSWSVRLRRPLLSLPEHDASLLRRRLDPLLAPVERHLDAYQQAGRRLAPSVRAR